MSDDGIPVDITPVDIVLSHRWRGGCVTLEQKLQEDANALEYIVKQAKAEGINDPHIEALFDQFARHMRKAALALLAARPR